MYVVQYKEHHVDVEVLNGDMGENICCTLGDVEYLFGEFAKKFVQFPNVCFGKGTCIVGIIYIPSLDDDVKDVDFWFDDGK